MGGMTLAEQICVSERIGKFNAYIVSSMMWCVVSFTILFTLGIEKMSNIRKCFLGFLFGIVTIPIGIIFAGLMWGIDFIGLIFILLPLIVFSAIVGVTIFLKSYLHKGIFYIWLFYKMYINSWIGMWNIFFSYKN